MKKAILLLSRVARDRIYNAESLDEISSLVDLTDCTHLVGDLEALKPTLADTEIIVSGWDMMPLDGAFLDAAPALEAVFYGAGSVRYFITDAVWQRGLLVTSAWASNAVPVIEYTVACMVFGLKKAMLSAQRARAERKFRRREDVVGMYGARIGIIGAGMIGRGVIELLQNYDVDVFCHDPHLDEDQAHEMGATPMGLDDLFSTCDCVSLHAPNLPTTKHMITGEHFRSMKDGAVFINTARGRIVNEEQMVAELKTGRVFAFIDVTDPEPPVADSPLYDLPNVFLSPHLAGPIGDEVHRNAVFVIHELRRFLAGEEPAYPVTEGMMAWMA